MKRAMVLLAVFGFVGSLWAADPFVGTWKMNLAKSTIAGQVPQSLIFKIEAFDGGLKWASDVVYPDGKAIKGMWAGKYDGKDYALTNNEDYDAISAKKVNANTFESVLKKRGKVVGSGRGVVSEDGKTLTLTSKYKSTQGRDISDINVLERQ